MSHTLYENHKITPLTNACGTLQNATYNGTSQGTVDARLFEYNAFILTGTLCNTGTVFMYGVGASQTNSLIGSFIFGSMDNSFVWEVKSDTLTNLGTLYTHLGANVAVDNSGTVRGAAFWLQSWPKSAGTTPLANGWGSVGTTLF